MLKITINKNNLKQELQPIIPSGMSYYNGDKIYISTATPHNLNEETEIFLRRYDEYDEILFDETIHANIIDERTFLIPSFDTELIEVINCEKIIVYSPINGGKFINLLKFETNGCNLITKRKQNIKKAYSNKNYMKKNFCKNDFILYNDIFLLKFIGDESKPYEDKIYNTKETLFLNNLNEIKSIDIFVGISFNGKDYNKYLYWEYNESEEEIAETIIERINNISFYFSDTRFFSLVDGNLEFRKDFDGNIDVSFYTVKDEIDVKLNINEKHDVSLLKNEYYNTFYVDEKIDENINSIVDMEKQIFIPRLYKKNTEKHNTLINELNFKINIRKRENEWSSTEIGNDWYTGGSNGNTNITDIGFNDDDIKYQKSSLKNTFLRLSFYDTPSRGNQKLLFYSTVFLDSNKISHDFFAKNIVSDLEFNIKNSFENTACSEGYYLYLYPKWGKADIPTDIYMKIEFNHAKFGKTVPLVLPSTDAYKEGYIDTDNEYSEGINNLFNDMYIKVNTMYDSKTNKYIWFIPNDEVNDDVNKTITMTLYEPIVNKINESGYN